MKKLGAILFAFIIMLVSTTFMSCTISILGTYKFVSVTYTDRTGKVTEMKVGDKNYYGDIITEEWCVLELLPESVVKMKINNIESPNGSWSIDRDMLTLTFDGETTNGTVKFNTVELIMVNGSENMRIVLKKVKWYEKILDNINL